jgi:tripartite-type tricarboxylate transporter receptor subunit TctC
MRHRSSAFVSLLCAATCLAATTTFARADAVEEFYSGKQISFIIGYHPGDTYDAYARLAAQALPRFIPGHPAVVPQNMPGASSLKAGDVLNRQAPHDGTAIGMLGQGIALQQALKNPAVRFDIRKFNWIGRLSAVMNFTVGWRTPEIRTIEDVRTHEMVIAATSPDAITAVIPRIMNRVAGTRFKIVTGYPGVSGMLLAMERGEVGASTATAEDLLYKHADWVRDGKLAVLVVQATTRYPAFPNTPSLVELGRTDEERQILTLYGGTAMLGRSIMAPPDVPPVRVAALRAAFDAMVHDPDFLAEIKKRRMEFDPLPGAELQKFVAGSLNLAPGVAERAARAAQP